MPELAPPPGWDPPEPEQMPARPPEIRKRKRRKMGELQNPQKLRAIIERHRNMGSAEANADKRAYLGALKYLPHAIYKLLENIPQPWEAQKTVRVLYHTAGALTFVDEIPVVDPVQYMAMWGQAWTEMRSEKRDRTVFRRMRLPPFDDEEKPMKWKEVQTFVSEDPEPVIVQQPTTDFEALKFAQPFLMNREPPACFDMPSFITAKTLHTQIPNGPRFEDQDNDDTLPSALDNPQQIIVRPWQFPVRTETRVVYPYLYGDVQSSNVEPVYDEPVNVVIERHDNKRAFFVDSSITQIPGQLPENDNNPEAFLAGIELNDAELAQSLAAYHSQYPFNASVRKPVRSEDVALVKPLYVNRRPLRSMAAKTRSSYQRLLKRNVKQALATRKAHRHGKVPPRLLRLFANTQFFERTKIDWLEAGIQLCHQGYQILQLLIHKRGLHFMHLDYNFNLKPTKTLTTKERKRSRFGNAFHLTRELLKLVKLVVDCHIQYRIGRVDAFELADGLHYVFTHLGQLTGIYRYKYRVMHQITACNDLKHVIYDRFNMDGVGKGAGCGVWQPSWRVWLGFVRGALPMLERWLGNLINRQFFGRVSKGIAKTITKQRVDSHYDLELRAAVLHDILDVIPEQLRASKTKVIMQHFSEAWRCWKANIPWDVPGMPGPVKQVIDRYIAARADNYIKVTHTNRERISAGKTVDKAVARKNLGRLTRLWLQNEQRRQNEYATNGPSLAPQDAVVMYKTMAAYLRARQLGMTGSRITLKEGDSDYAVDTKLLTLALESLRAEYNMTARLTNTQREELLLIEKAYDNPYEAITSIKETIRTQRVFKNIEVSMLDFHDQLVPVYHVDTAEKMVDAYLDQYLWYEADKIGLFPDWVKPSDDEVAPMMIRKFCDKLSGDPLLWSSREGESTSNRRPANRRSALLHMQLSKFIDNADFTLLNQLLRLILDDTLSDYITAKMNASLSYKDMSHIQLVGIIRGFQFSSFVVQYYLMMVDILLLGLPTAIRLSAKPAAGSAAESAAAAGDTDHPIRVYLRHVDHVYLAASFSPSDAEDLLREFSHEIHNDSVLSPYPLKQCWPRDKMMQLTLPDVQFGRALFSEFSTRVPPSMGVLKCEDASIYSVDNSAYLFGMAGFEVRLSRVSRQLGFDNDDDSEGAGSWFLNDPVTGERLSIVTLRVSDESINRFNNRMRQILMSSGSTTFAKIVKRWNTALTAMATYFREAAVATPKLLDVIVKNEVRVQNKIKMGLNSKMPARFPPCVFYSPEELGGLGMLSASHIMIPETDIFGKTRQFKFGMGDKSESLIPNIFRYITPWEAEAVDSQRVWLEYAHKRADAIASNSRVSLEDLEDLWDRGLPRISTLFQKDRAILALDKGFRLRQEFKNFSNEKFDPFWWVNSRHDGRLWNFTNYRTDVIESLGGIQSILEHTMFRATGFGDWEGLFWQKQSGFEQQMQLQKLTNAQRAGLSQIPNRRFTLWWSPTINRANVYVGFLVQLDLTGIFLHGKIPTLKISYIQIFRAHLWQKIHESLVMDVCQILDREQGVLAIDGVEKLPIHPRKSYRMNASTADILVTSSNGGVGWAVSHPCALNSDVTKFDFAFSDKFWIDIQLRYGDFDSHDIARYTKAKFLDHTSDGVSSYPSKTGLMICIDLAYNTYDAYGHWFPGLMQLMRQALLKVMQSNPALYILRERIRKALQLYQNQPQQQARISSSNFAELLEEPSIVVDDTAVYRTTLKRTKNGNNTTKPINGALFMLNPGSGKLYMTLIHAETVWAGQKKLGAVSKWKAAEEVANALRQLQSDDTQMPKQVVVNTRGLRDPVEVNMLEFSNVSVRNAEFALALSALLNIPRIKTMVDSANAADTELHTINLYDDWLNDLQPSTAFSRLILILRALLVDSESVKTIFAQRNTYQQQQQQQDEANGEEAFFWPRFDKDVWVEVETLLSDLVVESYAKEHAISKESLTQGEIRDIIMGQSISLTDREKEISTLDSSNNRDDDTQATALATRSHNVHGDEITVVTTSKYENQGFESRGTWRNRALEAASSLHYRSLCLNAQNAFSHRKVVIPQNVIRDFVQISDVRNMVLGLVFGRCYDDGQYEVCSIGIVPQLGSTTNVSFSPLPDPSELPDGSDLQLIGFVRSQPRPRADAGISPVDLSILANRELDDIWEPENMVVLTLNYEAGSISVQGFQATRAGIDWGSQNQDLLAESPTGYDSTAFSSPVEVTFSEDEGYFYVPQDELWNFTFMSTMWNAKNRAFLKIGMPIAYYDSIHRPIHFSRMGKLEDNFDIENELV